MADEPIARFVVTGTPIPYARARTVQLPNGATRYFTDPKSKKYRSRVASAARNASRWVASGDKLVRRSPVWPDEDDCKKEIAKASLRKKGAPLPKCSCPWCSTKYRLELLIALPDKRTRDLDNIEKNILDACTGVLWWDDRQAFVQTKNPVISKTSPRVEVFVRLAEGQERLAIEADDPFSGECVGWETERAREFLLNARKRFHAKFVEDEGELEGELAALLRDCWGSGLLEGMDAEPTKPLGPRATMGKAGGEQATKKHLSLVTSPKETDGNR